MATPPAIWIAGGHDSRAFSRLRETNLVGQLERTLGPTQPHPGANLRVLYARHPLFHEGCGHLKDDAQQPVRNLGIQLRIRLAL